MRTTLNIDDDVAEQLTEIARRRGVSVSRVATEAIRMGLRTVQERRRVNAYDPPTFDTGRPLVDVTDIGEALEVLDDG
jgi:hypothetical protein